MNLTGKIFTVLVFLMSLVFMSFAVAVYSTHTNWREKVMNPDEGTAARLTEVTAENEELKTELDTLTTDLAREQIDRREVLAKLETEKERIEVERKSQEGELARLKDSLREATTAMEDLHKKLAELRVQIGVPDPNGPPAQGLTQQVEQVKKEREVLFGKVVELTDQLHQAVNSVRALEKRNKELAADYANAKKVSP